MKIMWQDSFTVRVFFIKIMYISTFLYMYTYVYKCIYLKFYLKKNSDSKRILPCYFRIQRIQINSLGALVKNLIEFL